MPGRPTPRQNVLAECDRHGTDAVVAGCVALLERTGADDALIVALGGLAAESVLAGAAGGPDGYWPRVWAARDRAPAGLLHHVELWVPDLARAVAEWGWLLGELGYAEYQDWPDGRSWKLGATYLVVEQSPALSGAAHERTRPGLNHLAFHAGDATRVDALCRMAPGHGWTPLFADAYPHAGGPGHYAAYLANSDGYEIELVAAVGTGP